MTEFLRHIDPGYLIMIAFAAGAAWMDRRTRDSRVSQGKRIGDLEDRVTAIEAQTGMGRAYLAGMVRPRIPGGGDGG